MKTIFLTGANGYIGKHLLTTLLDNNYQVLALTRRKGAPETEANNLKWIHADLSETTEINNALQQADLIVHTAMGYDKDGNEMAENETNTVNLFLESNKSIIYTGNLFSTNTNHDHTIYEELNQGESVNYRNQLEEKILTHSQSNAVIRLACVYGSDGSYVEDLLPKNEQGSFFYNEAYDYGQWPMVSVFDVVDLYMNVIKNNLAGVFHAAPNQSTSVKNLIHYIAKEGNNSIEHIDIASLEALNYSHQKKIIFVSNTKTINSGWKINNTEFMHV